MSSEPWTILCDGSELAVECARAASELGLPVDPRVVESPLDEGAALVAAGRIAVAIATPPAADALVRLSTAAAAADRPIVMAMVGARGRDARARDLARDLGIAAVDEVRPLVSAMALLDSGGQPWTASARALPAVDRERLAVALGPGEQGRFVRADDGRLAYEPDGRPSVTAGEPRDVADAIVALEAADGAARLPMPRVEGVVRETVLDVIFGPPRSLSDPASKAALAPYDVPLPIEELCTSPSRAASEAARIGFPVRIALASPDLRVWDHPDLAADGVDNAARVRDVFRQIMALAKTRAPEARLLGVTVSATTPAHAMLRVRVTPLPAELVLVELGFADAHGLAADDLVRTVLPAAPERLERALARLSGSSLLLAGGVAERRRTVEALDDVLLRLAAFVNDWRQQVIAVEVDPLALLVGGGVEVREACVEVGDAFVRSLEASGDQRVP